jgi:hypothetical protein
LPELLIYRFAKRAAPPKRAPRPRAAVWIGAGLLELVEVAAVAAFVAEENCLEPVLRIEERPESMAPVADERSDEMSEIPVPTAEVPRLKPLPMFDATDVAPEAMSEMTEPGLGMVRVAWAETRPRKERAAAAVSCILDF